MASLKDIRRRITSVKSTQQITKAMKMVAAAKLRRAQQAIAGARPYAKKLEEATGRIIGEIMEGYVALPANKKQELLSKLHPLLKTESTKVDGDTKTRVGLVIIAADRGLCGAYNSNIIKFSHRRYKELASQPNTEVVPFYIGKRAFDFFSKRGMSGHFYSDFWAGRFTTRKSDVVADELVAKFLSGELDRVEICYTQFKSALSQTPESKQILPITIPVESIHSDNSAAPFIYEPNRKDILGVLLPKQVKTQIYRLAAESLASEFGSKMTSMDNATRNASEMIARLTLESNRVRQASITRELMEIIGGAEALKG